VRPPSPSVLRSSPDCSHPCIGSAQLPQGLVAAQTATSASPLSSKPFASMPFASVPSTSKHLHARALCGTRFAAGEDRRLSGLLSSAAESDSADNPLGCSSLACSASGSTRAGKGRESACFQCPCYRGEEAPACKLVLDDRKARCSWLCSRSWL